MLFFLILTLTNGHSQSLFDTVLALENLSNPNYTEIIRILEEERSPGALGKLGELWLIGFPDLHNQISRNYTIAFQYLTEGAKLGDGDSMFLLHVMYQESLLTNEFSEVLMETTEDIVRNNVIRAILKNNSWKFQLSYLAALQQCVKSDSLETPDFLNKTSLKFPFLKPIECLITRDSTFLALKAAHKTVEFIQKNGRVDYRFKRIDLELKNAFGDESEKILSMLSNKYQANAQPDGFASIGEAYMFGNNALGIGKNPVEGLKYFEQAAELGSTQAASTLGTMYSQGIGVEKNHTKALEYLEKAMEEGSVKAMITLGIMYRNGSGVKQNFTRAFEYTKLAVDLGDLESLSNLAVFYLNGEGVEKNITKALEYMEKAAKSGFYAGKFNLGLMLYDGEGIAQDYKEAMKLFLEVIYEGQLDQYVSKAYKFYRQGGYKSAYLCYLIASSLGYQSARLSLAYMFEKDVVANKCSGGKDACIGHYLFRAIAEDQDQWANEKMAKILYSAGEQFTNSYEIAYKYYQNAPISGNVLFTLGYMTEQGIGCQSDYDKALSYYSTIVEKSQTKEIDSNAKFPAFFALYKLKSKMVINQLISRFY